MNDALVRHVDPFKHVGIKISGQLSGNDLERWKHAPDRAPKISMHPVQVDLSIERSDQYLIITGDIQTKISLVCQRCLSALEHVIVARICWSPVNSTTQADALPDHIDPVEINNNGMVDLYWQIEDQLLLELPEAPKHLNVDACEQNNTVKTLRTHAL